MNDHKKIIWLASYPKSGNTWFRAFLTALMNPESNEVDINNMVQSTIASSRQLFDDFSGVESSDLTADEIDLLRPGIYRQDAMEADEIMYHKIHDAWQILPGGSPMFPEDVTKGVIYFVRNPLDVVVSFSHHLDVSIDKTIDIINNPDYAFCSKNNKLHNQLRQKLDTWSRHVKSWTEDSPLPVLVLRYEDMKADALKTFTRAVEFLGLEKSRDEIERAVGMSSFEELRKREALKGFSEKSAKTSHFFRKGIVGDWKNVLTADQVNRIWETHGQTMLKFGYSA